MEARAPDYGTHALAAAMTFALAVALFAYGGSWLDDKLGTSPLFLVVGCLLGAAGGMLHMISRLAPGALPFGRRAKSPPPPSGPREKPK